MIATWLVLPAAAEPIALERLDVGLFVATVEVGDAGPRRLVVDTGAGLTVLTPACAEAAGAVGKRSREAEAAGGPVDVQLTTLSRLVVGDVALDDVPVAVLDLSAVADQLGPVDGILGRTFFERADVALDGPAATLEVHPPGWFRDHPPDGAAFVGVPFRLKGGVIEVRGSVGDERTRILLDTGANQGSIGTTLASSAGGQQQTGAGQAKGADGRWVDTVPYTFTELSLGDLRVPAPMLWASATERLPTVGIDLLGAHVLLLSYDRRELWIRR